MDSFSFRIFIASSSNGPFNCVNSSLNQVTSQHSFVRFFVFTFNLFNVLVILTQFALFVYAVLPKLSKDYEHDPSMISTLSHLIRV